MHTNRSLVTVRNQLPAQGVKQSSNARHLSSAERKKREKEKKKEKRDKNRRIQLTLNGKQSPTFSEGKLFSKLRASGERPLIAKLNLTRRETSPGPIIPTARANRRCKTGNMQNRAERETLTFAKSDFSYVENSRTN